MSTTNPRSFEDGRDSAELRRRLAKLSPEKQALLERRLMARSAVREPPTIERRENVFSPR